MNKCLVGVALAITASVGHGADVQLRCSSLPTASKTFTFAITIDRTRNQVFVEGQNTTDVFISEPLTTFVLADDKSGYAFDIYADGKLVATHQKNHSTLLMQCT